jgi:hypothetical protein
VDVVGKSPCAMPHSFRQSAALYFLIPLNELFESRYGLTPPITVTSPGCSAIRHGPAQTPRRPEE